MPRGHKQRYVSEQPQVTVFKPAGVRTPDIHQVELSVDEFEALRLADHEGLYHDAAADRMGISRPTFGRLIAAARQKVAAALVNGQALRIHGGPVVVGQLRTFDCTACNQTFHRPHGAGPVTTCPNCGSTAIQRTDAGPRRGRCRRGWKRRGPTADPPADQAVNPPDNAATNPGPGLGAGRGLGGGKGRGCGGRHGRGPGRTSPGNNWNPDRSPENDPDRQSGGHGHGNANS